MLKQACKNWEPKTVNICEGYNYPCSSCVTQNCPDRKQPNLDMETENMTCKHVDEGKIFYEHGKYNIMINGLDADIVENVVKALRGIVYLRRPRSFSSI